MQSLLGNKIFEQQVTWQAGMEKIDPLLDW